MDGFFFVFSWLGPILVVISLAVPNAMWFRLLNLTGSTIAAITAYIDGFWPFVFMNTAIALINIYWIWRMTQNAKTQAGPTLVRVGREASLAGTWGPEVQAEAQKALAGNATAQLVMVVQGKAVTSLAVLGNAGAGRTDQVLWSTPATKSTVKEVEALAAIA